MPDIFTMKAQRASVIKEARSIIDQAANENRMLTDEEDQRLQELNDDIDRRQVMIEHEERQQSLESNLEQRDHEPHKPDPAQSTQEEQRNWRSFGEQMQAVYRAAVPGGRIDQRLSTRAASGLNESIGTDGGFLVQQDFTKELFRGVERYL